MRPQSIATLCSHSGFAKPAQLCPLDHLSGRAQSADMSKAQRHLKWAVYVATLALVSFGCTPNVTPAASFSPSASVIAYSPEPPRPSLFPSPLTPTAQPSPTPEPPEPAPLEDSQLKISLRFRCRGGYQDVYATITNNSPFASGLIYFYTKSWVRTYVRLGRNTTKAFWTEDWVQRALALWVRVEGRAIPPGSKATYSFTVTGKYPEQGGNPLVAILVGDEDWIYTESLKFDNTCKPGE